MWNVGSRFFIAARNGELNESGMARRGAVLGFFLQAQNPAMLGFKFGDHEFQHPHGFMIGVTDFLENFSQRFFLAENFAREELFAALKLCGENTFARLPGKCHPREEVRLVAMGTPILALEGIGKGGSAVAGYCVALSFGAARIAAICATQQT